LPKTGIRCHRGARKRWRTGFTRRAVLLGVAPAPVRAWKVELAALAAEIGRDITVAHYPSGTSKWNKIEHRLFAFISINWRGRPLTDYQVVIETIAATTTDTGLTVEAVLDEGTYPTGMKVTKAQMKAVPLAPHQFHGEWNYCVARRSDIDPTTNGRDLEDIPGSNG
jgi:Rhodopirellula transposase DDE domain